MNDEFDNLVNAARQKVQKPKSTPYDNFINESAEEFEVDPELIRVQMDQESRYKPNAKSPKGAMGLMQLMPDTAKRFGVTDPYDPKQNIRAGTKYMRWLLDRYDDVDLALAGYNAGEGSVDKYGRKIPPFKETQNYVKNIRSQYTGSGRLMKDQNFDALVSKARQTVASDTDFDQTVANARQMLPVPNATSTNDQNAQLGAFKDNQSNPNNPIAPFVPQQTPQPPVQRFDKQGNAVTGRMGGLDPVAPVAPQAVEVISQPTQDTPQAPVTPQTPVVPQTPQTPAVIEEPQISSYGVQTAFQNINKINYRRAKEKLPPELQDAFEQNVKDGVYEDTPEGFNAYITDVNASQARNTKTARTSKSQEVKAPQGDAETTLIAPTEPNATEEPVAIDPNGNVLGTTSITLDASQKPATQTWKEWVYDGAVQQMLRSAPGVERQDAEAAVKAGNWTDAFWNDPSNDPKDLRSLTLRIHGTMIADAYKAKQLREQEAARIKQAVLEKYESGAIDQIPAVQPYYEQSYDEFLADTGKPDTQETKDEYKSLSNMLSFESLRKKGVYFTDEEIQRSMTNRAANDKVYQGKVDAFVQQGSKRQYAELLAQQELGRIDAATFGTLWEKEKEAEAYYTPIAQKATTKGDASGWEFLSTPDSRVSAGLETSKVMRPNVPNTVGTYLDDLIDQYGNLRTAKAVADEQLAAWNRLKKRALTQPKLAVIQATVRPIVKGFFEAGVSLADSLAGVIDVTAQQGALGNVNEVISSALKSFSVATRKKLERDLSDSDMRQFAMFSSIPEALGGVLAQWLAMAATGGGNLGAAAATTLGASQGMAEQLRLMDTEGRTTNLPNTIETIASSIARLLGQNKIADTLETLGADGQVTQLDKLTGMIAAAVLAVPDFFIFRNAGEGGKALFIDNFLNGTFRKLAQVVGEREALEVTRQVLGKILQVGYSSLKSGISEGTQESVEATGNQIVRKLTYNPETKVLWFNKDDFIGGLTLGPLAGAMTLAEESTQTKKPVQTIGISDLLTRPKEVISEILKPELNIGNRVDVEGNKGKVTSLGSDTASVQFDDGTSAVVQLSTTPIKAESAPTVAPTSETPSEAAQTPVEQASQNEVAPINEQGNLNTIENPVVPAMDKPMTDSSVTAPATETRQRVGKLELPEMPAVETKQKVGKLELPETPTAKEATAKTTENVAPSKPAFQRVTKQNINEITTPMSKQAANVVKALTRIAPDAEVRIHTADESYLKAVKESGGIPDEATGTAGFFFDDGKTIHINSRLAQDSTVFHEGVHAVVAAAFNRDKALMRKYAGELRGLMPTSVQTKYIKFVNQYKPDQRAEEFLAEVLGDIASGKLDLDAIPKSTVARLKDWFRSILKTLGFNPNEFQLSSNDDVATFARKVSTALREGKELTVKQQPKQSKSADTSLDFQKVSSVEDWDSAAFEKELAGIELKRDKDGKITNRNLVVAHNLSESNLTFSNRLGGIAMPSLAITKPDVGFTGFGEITLVGPPSMAIPSRQNPITDADMYSPRYPKQQIFTNAQKMEQEWPTVITAYNKFYPDQTGYSDEALSALGMRERLKDDGPEALSRNKAFQIYALAKSNIIDKTVTAEEYYPLIAAHRTIIDDAANAFIEKLDPEYKFFKGYTNLGNRRYGVYDLATVLKDMKSQMKEGEGFNYGAGSVRAAAAAKFKSLKEIQKSRDRIISGANLEVLKDEAQQELLHLADRYAPFYKYDAKQFGYYNSFADAVVDGLRTRNMRRVFEEYGFANVDDWTPLNEYLTKLRNLPTAYFEAKPQRIVRLDEFSAAVVPSDISATVRQILERHGLNIIEYERGNQASRSDAVRTIAQQYDLLFKKRDAGSVTRLNDELPYETNVVPIIDNTTSTLRGKELEVNEYGAELIRRTMEELNGLDEQSFDGMTATAGQMRPVITRLEAFSNAAKTRGINTAPLDALVKNLKNLFNGPKAAAIYVFDDALPEERVHVEDINAGRTQSLDALRKTDLWKNPGELFESQYPNVSDHAKASEIAAKILTGQAAKYGWTDKAANDAFLEIWAQGFDAEIKRIGTEEFRNNFPTIAKLYENTTGNRKGQRTKGDEGLPDQKSQEIGDRTKTQEGAKTGADEGKQTGTAEKDGQQESDRRLSDGDRVKNRRFAVSLAENLYNVGDVEYAPETEKGWSERALAKVEKDGIDASIEAYRKMSANESTGNKTALGIAIALEMYNQGKTDQLTEFGVELTNNIGNAAQELRAAALLSRLSPAFAGIHADKIVRKAHNRPATAEEKAGAVLGAQKVQETGDALTIVEEAEAVAKQSVANYDERIKAISNVLEAERTRSKATEADLEERLRKAQQQAQYYKEQSEKKQKTHSRKEVQKLRSDIEKRKTKLMEIVRAALPNAVLKSVANRTGAPQTNNDPLKSVSTVPPTRLDPTVQDALVQLSAAKLIDDLPKGLTLEQFGDWLNKVTDNTLSDTERGIIHALAYDMIRPEHAATDAAQRALINNRARHARQANKVLFADEIAAKKATAEQQKSALKTRDAFRNDKFARAMVKTANDLNAAPEDVFMAFAIRETPNKRVIQASFKEAFPDGNFDDALVRGMAILNTTKANLERARYAAENGKTTLTDRELIELKQQKAVAMGANRKARKALEQYYNEIKRGIVGNALNYAVGIFGLPKTLMSTGEVSFALRQGFLPAILFGREWAGTVPVGSYKGLRSPEGRMAYELSLREDPYFNLAEHYGVAFSQIGNSINVDEHFPSVFLEKWAETPTEGKNALAKLGIKTARLQQRFEHAYTLPGDALRLAVFKNLAQVAEGANLTPEQLANAYRYAAKVANVSVGKSDLLQKVFGNDSAFLKFLGAVGFAPSLLASRVEAGLIYSPIGIALAPTGMKKTIAKKTARLYGTLGLAAVAIQALINALGRGDDDDNGKVLKIIDPSSRDFLKLRFRNGLRVDLTSNMSEWMKLWVGDAVGSMYYAMTEMAGADPAGIEKAGDIWKDEWDKYIGLENENGKIVAGNGFLRYWRGKLSPGASFVADWSLGSDFIGRPVTVDQGLWGAATSRMLPLTYQQTYDAFFYDPADNMMKEPQTIERGWERVMNLKGNEAFGRAGNAAAFFLLSAVGVGVNQYETFESTPAKKKMWDLYDPMPSQKSAEQKRVESGIRILYKYEQKLAEQGQSTKGVTEAIDKFQKKYNFDNEQIKKLRDQAYDPSFKFGTARMTAAQVTEILKYAETEDEKRELELILNSKINKEKRKKPQL